MISQADATIGPTNTTTNISPHHHHLSHHHHHHHHNHHHDLHSNLHPQPARSPQPNQLIAHNGRNTTKPFTGVIKKRKRFEESIVDGFAIASFKTWEDLQDELNETSTLANINSNSSNNNNDTTNKEAGGKSVDDNKSSSNNNNNKKFDSIVKKVSSKIKHNKSSGNNNNKSNASAAGVNNSVSTSTTSSATSTSDSTKDSGSSSLSSKKKDKSKKSNSQTQSPSPKEKRNKTSSSNKDSLKKALEAKDLAEKQLSIVQEQLKKEQNKNRYQDPVNDPKTNPVNSNTTNPNDSDTTVTTAQSITTDNYTQNYNVSTPRQVHNQFDHNAQSTTRTNEVFGHDLMKDPALLHKQNVYPPYHINPHMHRTNSIIHQSIQVHTPMSPNRILQTPNLSQSQHPMNKHLLPANLSNQHSTSTPPPHPTLTQSNPNQTCQSLGTLPTASSNGQIVIPNPSLALTTLNQKTSIHQHPQSSVTTLQQSTLNQTHQSFTRLPPHQPTTAPINPSPIHPHLMPPHMHPSAMLPYPNHQPNPLISPMSLPYNCPPSIYITDTISRQTSIIPPPGQMLDQPTPSTAAAAAAAAAACRFNQSSVLHSITPYNPATVPAHHPSYYPSLPTERSFIELARSYTSPGHLGYSNLMGSFPTQPPGFTANPYNFDRWPRVPMEHQRSISRYNSIYQSSTAAPDRTFTNYTSATRPPTFPAGLFPPPF